MISGRRPDHPAGDWHRHDAEPVVECGVGVVEEVDSTIPQQFIYQLAGSNEC